MCAYKASGWTEQGRSDKYIVTAKPSPLGLWRYERDESQTSDALVVVCVSITPSNIGRRAHRRQIRVG